MTGVIQWIESAIGSLPFTFLDAWGRFAFFVGCGLAIAAFGGFTFRPGGRWGLGRERQAWDANAILAIPVTFILILVTGYIGSFVVLVPGAQTFESLKDLAVFLCIVLFGYPALLAVPFAYGLSDLIEGVPPEFLRDWMPGYFINPACFWMAYQLFGKDPDFRRPLTWARYGIFVLLFLVLEPILWGYICAGKFTPEISYRTITPALFFTTGLTWVIAPVAMLGALPLARRFGMFWAGIPGHVKERRLGRKEWTWEAGGTVARPEFHSMTEGWPIRMLILTPFIAITLTMVGATAWATLRSAEEDANKLTTRLHDEISTNIAFQVDEYLSRTPVEAGRLEGIRDLLKNLTVSQHGLALLIDRSGRTVASSAEPGDPVAAKAVAALAAEDASPERLKAGLQFRFHHVTEKPLDRKTWLARTTVYRGRGPGSPNWIVLTAMPESYYLAGVKAGNSRSAMIFALALVLALGTAAMLAAKVTGGIRRISLAAQGLAKGDLTQRVPPSKLEELDTLANSFNEMAGRLSRSIGDLREQELFMRLAQEAAKVGSWELDFAARRFKWSEGLAQMHGIRSSEFDGRLDTVVSFCHPRDVARFRQILAGNMLDTAANGFECRIVRRDGVERDLWFLGRLHLDDQGKPAKLLGIAIDITERRTLEEQFRQAQKMEAVGLLAGGIAHDFNNLLTAILGFSEFLKDSLDPSDPRRNDAEEVIATAQRATGLTRQLLAFSRRQVLNPVLLDLNASIREMRKMLQRIIGEDVALEVRPGPSPTYVKVDAGQVEQAILNLAVNARDAMPRGGRLTIETRAVTLDEAACRGIENAKPGPYMQLSISDTGSGMTSEILGRIFEPFFTTKGIGKGTGLGLPMVYGFVQQSGGHVEIHSEVDRGTTFHMRFPPAQDAVGPLATVRPAASTPGGTESVLIVEDDAAVRRLTARSLESSGYRVHSADSGEMALKVVEGLSARIDILVTDVVMPGMSGSELAEALQKRIPELAVLFVSGYTDDDVLRHGLLRAEIHFLQKPFSPMALAAKVRAVLDGRPGAG